MSKDNINTGNPIVDRIGHFDFKGNLIPESWYHTITNEKGAGRFNSYINIS